MAASKTNGLAGRAVANGGLLPVEVGEELEQRRPSEKRTAGTGCSSMGAKIDYWA